jgi:hypothetical protein
VQFSVISDEITAGSATFINGSDVSIYDETGESDAARTGRNDLIVSEDQDGTIYVNDLSGNLGPVAVGEDDADAYDFLDIEEEEAGVSPSSTTQQLANPNSSNGYYGEAGQVGAVRQTHQNPDGSYTAVDGSPVANEGNASTGSDVHYGGSTGYYDLDGLHTDHLDGETLVEDEDHYDAGQTGTGISATGAYHGETGLHDSGEDGFSTDLVDEGFAGFTWDHVIKTSITKANATADVINNFHVDIDIIGFEGDIEDTTNWGEIEHVDVWGNFDLDWHEFGLVGSGSSGLNGADLSNEHLISALLNDAFNLYASEDRVADYNDTSIFAITAQDDPSKTAIWVHTQSTGDDITIDANELTLLAIVNTIGGEFKAENLVMLNNNWVV